ncbi:MAG: hypothetical protein JWN83_2149 [Chitinophagaceae bacterium]|nr:hypothetical protein [Chitinophagaceae bacterium]
MKLFIIAALLLISISSFAQSNILKSTRNSAIKIDGDASEWSQPLRFYDKDTKLFFDFSNDDSHLFLCFQTNDNAEQMKIMLAGMTVTLKIKGNGKASIKFPLQQAEKNMMQVKGFKTKDGVIAANDNSGINVSIGRSDNNLAYEIAIPLKELSGDDYIKDFDKDLELTVEIHPLKQPGSGDEKNYSGGQGGGRGKMGGGGGGQGRGGGQRNDESSPEHNTDRTSMSEKTEFKQKFTLTK